MEAKLTMLREISNQVKFVGHLVKLNVASNMEYRASFLMQAVGMFLNNGIYFIFWLIFFDRFTELKGYGINEIFLLFAVVTFGFGMAFTLAGNTRQLSSFIAQGRLDYYLTLPRPVLPHVLFSRMDIFALGDFSFGILAYIFTGRFDVVSIGLFLIVSCLVAVIFISVFTIFGCLAFFMGNANEVSFNLSMSMVTFSMYPNGIFQGFVRIILYTLIPAAFVGAIPVEIVDTANLQLLGLLVSVALFLVLLASAIFQMGLRCYESGSAINVNM